MTATQVFCRFAKESGYYHVLMKSVNEALEYGKRHSSIKEGDFDSLKIHGKKRVPLDELLKIFGRSLSDVLYILHCESVTFRNNKLYNILDKKWNKYIRENLNGNYYKAMILDSFSEFDTLRLRNGHHVLIFTFKQKE